MRSTIQSAKRRLLSLSSNVKADRDFDQAAATKLRNASRSEKSYFFAMLDTAETGLSAAQVHQKQQKYGPNEVDHEKAPATVRTLYNCPGETLLDHGTRENGTCPFCLRFGNHSDE